MLKRHLFILLCFFVLFSCVGCNAEPTFLDEIDSFDWTEWENNEFEQKYIEEYRKKNICYGPIDTAEKAVEIAQKHWFTRFSRTDIRKQCPYLVSYDEKNRVWNVSGNPDWIYDKNGAPSTAGTATIFLSQDEGRVLLCYHT